MNTPLRKPLLRGYQIELITTQDVPKKRTVKQMAMVYAIETLRFLAMAIVISLLLTGIMVWSDIVRSILE